MPDYTVSTDIDALLKSADDTAARAELGVAIGTDVQAHSAALDAVTGTNTGDQDLSGLQPKPSEGQFVDGDKTKLDDIEAGATKGGTAQDDSTLAIKPRLDTKIGSVAGDARGLDAVDLQIARNASTQVASGTRSMILVGTNNTASSAGATVIAASSSNASGTGSVIIGGSSNNASGSNDEILGSQNSSTSGTGSTIVGGSGCSNSGNWGIVLGGLNHQVTQPRGAVVGGSGNIVNHVNSAVIGCTNLTTDAGDTVYVPSLNVSAGFKMPTGAADDYILTSDASGVGSWEKKTKVQTVSTTAGVLSFDYSAGEIVKTTLTENVTSLAITNANEGDSGMIILTTDGLGAWTFAEGSNRVLNGLPNDVSTLTGSDKITIGYYYDGTEMYLYISLVG